MAHAVNFKLYLNDGDDHKTLTESHPKLTATASDFEAAGLQLNQAYNLELTEATVQSETTVYTAS